MRSPSPGGPGASGPPEAGPLRVLVTGGTGLVGAAVVDHLLEAGHTVRVLSRGAERALDRWGEGVEAHPGSVAEPREVAGAAAGCDVVLHTAGVAAEAPPEVTFGRVNVEGTRNVAAEAARAQVPRFVYLSSLGANRGTSAYHRSKLAGEEIAREYPGDWLVVRCGNVYGPGDPMISRFLRMVRTLPAVPVLGDGDRPFQPIWLGDLALALSELVVRVEPSGTVIAVAGEDLATMNRLLDIFERLTGKSPLRIPLPEWVAKLGARAADTLGIDVPLNRDQLTMILEENYLKEGETNAVTEILGLDPVSLEEGLALLSVTMPEQLPSEGTGRLYRNRYWADIRDARLDPDELFELIREEFYKLAPEGLLKVGAEPGSPTRPEEGATLILSLPLRGNVAVRTLRIEERTITFATLEGHFLSGAIVFSVTERSAPEAVRFEIRSYARPTDPMDRVAMETIGKRAQKATWKSVVREVVRRSGGEASDGVRTETRVLEGRDAALVEAWVDGLVTERRRRDPTGLLPPV